jgi:hypothetical protein
MTLKRPGCYAALVFENCHSKERSSDVGRFRCLATVRVGREGYSPFHAGFIELLVVFKPGSAEDQSRGRSHDRDSTL